MKNYSFEEFIKHRTKPKILKNLDDMVTGDECEAFEKLVRLETNVTTASRIVKWTPELGDVMFHLIWPKFNNAEQVRKFYLRERIY